MKKFEGMGLWDRIKDLFSWGEKAKILHAIAVCKRAAGSDELMSLKERTELAEASRRILAALRPEVREEMLRNVQVGAFGVIVKHPQGIELLLVDGCFGSGEGAITRADAVNLLKTSVDGVSLAQTLAGRLSTLGYYGAQNIELLMDVATGRSDHERSDHGFGAESVNEEKSGVVQFGQGEVPKLNYSDRSGMADAYSRIAEAYLVVSGHEQAAFAFEGAAACMSQERSNNVQGLTQASLEEFRTEPNEAFSEERMVTALNKAYEARGSAALSCKERGRRDRAAKAWERAELVAVKAGAQEDANRVRQEAADVLGQVALNNERNGISSKAAEAMKLARTNNEQGRMQYEKTLARQAVAKIDMKNQNVIQQKERDSETVRKNNSAGAIWEGKGEVQFAAKEYETALKFYKKAARMYSLAGNHPEMLKIYNKMLGIYEELLTGAPNSA